MSNSVYSYHSRQAAHVSPFSILARIAHPFGVFPTLVCVLALMSPFGAPGVSWAADSRIKDLPGKDSPINNLHNLLMESADMTLTVEVAGTRQGRVRGLSGRKSLPPQQGLLFDYMRAGRHGIWMKDMFFPIDIIWLDERMRVVDIKRHALPESYPEIFFPKQPAHYVLEVNAKSGIALGQTFSCTLHRKGQPARSPRQYASCRSALDDR